MAATMLLLKGFKTMFVLRTFLWVFLVSLAPEGGWALDAETMSEVRRLDQRIGRFDDRIEQILKDVRTLQRETAALNKALKNAQAKVKITTDTMVRMQNTDIANLIAVDKQLAQRLNEVSKHIEGETATWNWGSQNRPCDDVGKHQQIQSVRSADGQFSLRYLCYDGRAIHLGTEVNLPPQ